MPKTIYFANAMVDHALRGPSSGSPGGALARPNQVFIGLFTTPPTTAGGGVEVVGGGYVRTPVAFAPPVEGGTQNAFDVAFPDVNNAWGLVVFFGVFDSVFGGNLLYFERLADPRNVNVGDKVVFPAGQLVLVEM